MNPEKRYNELREEVLKNIDLLRKKIEDHHQNFQSNPQNWGYVGDISYFNEKIREIINP
jgi:hypothetical protein